MTLARRIARVLVIVLMLVVGATLAAVVVVETAWFKNWLRGYIVREANQYLNGQISIQRLGGNLFFGVELEDVGISMDGSQVVAVKDLGLDYNVFQMISKGVSLDQIRLNHPVIYLRRDGDGWSLSRLIKKQASEADRQGPQFPIDIDHIGISNGSVRIEAPLADSAVRLPKHIDHLDAKLSFHYEPVRYSIQVDHVSFRGSEPSIGLNAFSGALSVKDDTVYLQKVAIRTEESSLSIDGAVRQYLTEPDVNLQVSSDKISLPELAPILPALAGVDLEPAFELRLAGPTEHLGVDMNVRSSAGQLTATLVVDAASPTVAAAGDISVRHLDLAPILRDRAMRSDLTANAKVDLTAADLSNIDTVKGSVSLDSPRIALVGYAAERVGVKARFVGRRALVEGHAVAFGAAATVSGRIAIPAGTGPLSFDAQGHVRQLDLRRLPPDLKAPAVESNINGDYRVTGAYLSSKRGLSLPGLNAHLRFADSTVAGARIAAGSTAAVSLEHENVGYEADAEVTNLDLQRMGNAFNVPALADDRYKSDLNGHLTASGRGTEPAEMAVKASGSLHDSSILGAEIPSLSFDGSLSDDTAHITASGRFIDLDPAAVSGKPALTGTAAGTLDLDGSLSHVSAGVTLDALSGSVRATLEPSMVGGIAIDRLALDGDYRNRTGEIRAFEIVGRGVNAQASGTLALDDSGQSDLRFKADSSDLAQLGALADVPLGGIANIEGVVSGNRSELRATGALVAGNIKYGENGALASTTQYTVIVPDLDPERANVTADTKATFVSIAGQEINELTAKTTYAAKEVTFDATAKQPQRSLAAAGSAVLHPDHQEVHLERLSLESSGVQWQLTPGSPSAIQYGNSQVTVERLALVNGDQRIEASGTFGRAGDALRVTLKGVDLATVDAVLLREPQLSGRLDGNATLSGTTASPDVKADFQVNAGGFRRFRYDTFGGTLAYSGQGVTVDARLQQNATQWVSAKGYVPAALFSSNKTDENVDLVIDSSPIDLGIVQGFTTSLTNVMGTLEAHVRVTGTVEDPHPEGTITVADGAAKSEANGVAYRHINGRIDLQPERVHIDQITILDNHDAAVSITGDLALHERQVGGVQLYVTAEDFKVIDNKMGNVRIQSSLEIGGELTSPRIDGYLGISTGSVNLDEVLANISDSAYGTKEIEYTPKTGEVGAEAPKPSFFDALSVDVGFTVPNDLVVKASSIEAPGSPIGLGALNVTLGGDLRVTKQPGDTVRLSGAVNTIRGNYDFQGRRFDILRDGSVRFAGLDTIDPDLDIRTQRVIQGVEARVNVRGRLSQPEIVLSSTPPLEQADILALVVFNQPLNQLGEGDQVSLAARAQSLAAGAVASQLSQSLGRALNLDVFEINVAPENKAGTEVTLGQQLGQALYVRVEQNLGDDSSTNFILEYELLKWLRLQTNVLQGSSTQQSMFRKAQDSGADLIFFFSY